MNRGFSLLRKAGLLIIILGLALDFSRAWAGGLETARRRGKLLAGVKTDFPPFGYRDASGTLKGFDIEIAQYLAKELYGDKSQGLELVPVTSGSRIPFLYSEFIDVIIASTSITEDRKKVLEFTRPYYFSGSLVLVRKDSPYKEPQDLSGKNIGIIEGSIQETDVPELAPNAKLVKFATIDEALLALKGQKIDAFCQDDVVVHWLVEGNPDLQEVGRPFHPRPYAAAVRKGDLEFVNWINAQFEKAKQDGTYDRLLKKYFGLSGVP